MSYDGIVTRAAVREMEEACAGGRINRVHQPGPSLLRLDVYTRGSNARLLLDVSGNTPYAYLATEVPENPQKPSQFCMVLRKHLQNGRIDTVTQDGLDRILRLEVESRDELGVPVKRTLVAELMGKYANVFLLDENSRIIEALKRIPGDLSSVRPVYPGLSYESIPSDKVSLLDALVLPDSNEATRVQKWLLATYEGFGPPVTRELCFLASLDPSTPVSVLTDAERERLEETLLAFRERLASHAYAPSLMGDAVSFYAFPLRHLGEEITAYPTISACAQTYRKRKQKTADPQGDSRALSHAVAKRLERARVKYEKMKTEYEESLDREKDLLYADLLSANSHRAKRGATSVTVTNYFDETLPEIEIPLDPKKDVWQNAQAYYKSYSKQKNREKTLARMLPAVQSEIGYFLQVLQDLSMAESREEIEEIRSGLVEEGILNPRGRKKKKDRASRPLRFLSSDGYTIYVGKNSRQNDQLTMRTASREDWFFHAKDLPGSHVIVRAGQEELPEQTVREAAWLAARYSSEQAESHVLVDFTKKKNVRKQKGAKPGQVLYDPYETMTVDLKNPSTRPKLQEGAEQ